VIPLSLPGLTRQFALKQVRAFQVNAWIKSGHDGQGRSVCVNALERRNGVYILGRRAFPTISVEHLASSDVQV
jgi:hypothetical protein